MRVFITGGSGGIGFAVASAYAADGHEVILADINLTLAQEKAAELVAAGGNASAMSLDLTQQQSIEQAAAAAGAVDILVNNAGIMPMGYFLDEDPALADAQIDINFRGVIHGMQIALPGLLARGSGHIVNIASLAGRFALPGSAVYTGTKFAVVGMTEAVAGEYRDSGVQFTCIMPSKVLTELTSGTEKAASIIPSVTPEQVAEAVVGALLKPRLMVAVPDYLQIAHSAYTLIPSWLQVRGRRLLGDDRILSQLDHAAHAGYEQRINKLARPAKTSGSANAKTGKTA